MLIILICRSFVKHEESNYYLAFWIGILTSILNLTPIGWESMLYLLTVVLVQLFSRSRFTNSLLLIVPVVFVLMFGFRLGFYFALRLSPLLWPYILIEAIVALPIMIVVRLWEERFIVKGDIKLKL